MYLLICGYIINYNYKKGQVQISVQNEATAVACSGPPLPGGNGPIGQTAKEKYRDLD